jgi:copper chaperone NosL
MTGKVSGSILFLLIFLMGALAWGQTAEDIQKHPSCSYCGMDREKFAHSRMLVVYDDKSEFGACSLHCGAVNLAVNIDKTPQSMQVADLNSKNLIDAEKATWVIGGDKPGVMTKQAKWAFQDQPEAAAFIKEHGGKMASFEDAIKTAYEDIYSDTKMIREKRAKMKMMPQEPKK